MVGIFVCAEFIIIVISGQNHYYKEMDKEELKSIADMLFEAGILAKTPRSGFYFLGSGKQSVAEHLNRTAYIGYALAKMNGNVDMEKVLKMCLFHDFHEARTSDLNYVHQKYAKADDKKATDDLASALPFGDDIKNLMEEYEARETLESKIVKDADIIELLLSLKEQMDLGNEKAKSWIPPAIKRLKTKEGKQLAEIIQITDFDNWWFKDKDDKWWIDRNN